MTNDAAEDANDVAPDTDPRPLVEGQLLDTEELAEQLTDILFTEIRPALLTVAKTLLELSPAGPNVDLGKVRKSAEKPATDAPKRTRSPRSTVDEEMIFAALEMVDSGNSRDVAPNVMRSLRNILLVQSDRKGKGAKTFLTSEGKQMLEDFRVGVVPE